MNYRSRWQQRRRREAQKRTATLVGALMLCVIVVASLVLTRGDQPVWSRDLHSSRAVHFTEHDGVLYCALGDRRAQAISIRTGDPVWPRAYDATAEFGGPPAVSDTRVVFVDSNGRITALDRATGEGVWQVGTGDAVRCKPLIHDDLVFAGCSRGIVYALKASDGLEQWRLRAGGPVDSGFAVVDGRVLFGTSSGTVLGASWKSGDPLPWRERNVGFPALAGPVRAEDNVVVGTDGGRAFVISPATGRTVARVEMPDGGLVRAAPVVDAGRVYVAGTDGWIVAAELQDRGGRSLDVVWQRKIGAEVSAGPALDARYLYCGNGSRFLLAVDRGDGHIAHRWECSAPVRGSIAVAEGLVAVGAADGLIHVFRTPGRGS